MQLPGLGSIHKGCRYLGRAETNSASRAPSGTLQQGHSKAHAAPRALLQGRLHTYLTAPRQAPAQSPTSPQHPARGEAIQLSAFSPQAGRRSLMFHSNFPFMALPSLQQPHCSAAARQRSITPHTPELPLFSGAAEPHKGQLAPVPPPYEGSKAPLHLTAIVTSTGSCVLPCSPLSPVQPSRRLPRKSQETPKPKGLC